MNRREFIKSIGMSLVAIHFQPAEFFTPYTPKSQLDIFAAFEAAMREVYTPRIIRHLNQRAKIWDRFRAPAGKEPKGKFLYIYLGRIHGKK